MKDNIAPDKTAKTTAATAAQRATRRRAAAARRRNATTTTNVARMQESPLLAIRIAHPQGREPEVHILLSNWTKYLAHVTGCGVETRSTITEEPRMEIAQAAGAAG